MTWILSLGWEDPLEKEMATHSSILAWEIPWTEEPGGLQSVGSQKSWTQLRDQTTTKQIAFPTEGNSVSSSVVSDSLRPHGLWPTRLLCLWNSPGNNTGVGCLFFLQGIFLTQGLNLGFLHCRQILYSRSHQGRLYVRMGPNQSVEALNRIKGSHPP